MRLFFVCLISFVLSSACAHHRHVPGDPLARYRFNEMQLAENAWKIGLNGNGFSHADVIENLVLQKSAAVALEHGFKYFVIVENHNGVRTSTITMPTQSYSTGSAYVAGNQVYGQSTTTTYGGQTFFIHKPSSSNTIVCFKDKPEGFAYDAELIAPMPK